ncbi:hypothetical protein Btus_1065 [Kyrpidia tusciae DSM 2912]|uniref:Uncharacterized protein n=1 Tax=Kyrpidia tusciae (strain DSM 2912 / NBRC 15312 / T2) TaxID=562970 RepID=D5WWV1_KYRT2|nr:hypothetical protein Btus_1065 [Kyrpidia tusciae DSM 2912]
MIDVKGLVHEVLDGLTLRSAGLLSRCSIMIFNLSNIGALVRRMEGVWLRPIEGTLHVECRGAAGTLSPPSRIACAGPGQGGLRFPPEKGTRTGSRWCR